MKNEHFFQRLLQLAPDTQSARFLLAVSGGRDSVVLAHLFLKSKLTFDIAHCNFHLRGEESDKEMNFVQNLPFLTTQKVFATEFDTISIQQKSGKSIEMVARELRYQWFDEIGEEYDYIVTAHHANDNAETILLNLLRGTGLHGMCGIPPKNRKIIRPLLSFSSLDIERYARENKIPYCVDSSNLETRFLRNKIRHNVIPELAKIYPNCIEIFSKNSTLFLKQTHFFDAHIQQYKNQLCEKSENKTAINIEILKNIPLYNIVLYEILNPLGFNADDIENIIKSMNKISGKKFFSNTHLLIKDRTHFIITNREEREDNEVVFYNIEELEKYGFIIEKLDINADFQFSKSKSVIYIDADKLAFPLTIRNWKNGDFFYPFGMKAKKKVSDFFTDQKINLIEKQKISILCSRHKIVWIINHRADDRFKVDENTKQVYVISEKMIT